MIRSSQISKTKIEKEVLICWEGHLNHSTLTKTDECVAVQHVVIQRCVAASQNADNTEDSKNIDQYNDKDYLKYIYIIDRKYKNRV